MVAQDYLILSSILFSIGFLGIFINRKNIIIILMSIELMLLAANINFIGFSYILDDLFGQIFALFVLESNKRRRIFFPKKFSSCFAA